MTIRLSLWRVAPSKQKMSDKMRDVLFVAKKIEFLDAFFLLANIMEVVSGVPKNI